MKDNKEIIKGKDEHLKEIDELKSLWKSLDERLSSDKKLNHAIHSIESNYTTRRLSDFKRILSKEYSKMEAWIIVLETISKKLAEFMDKVDPQSNQSLMIKKILEKKDLMPLETIELFLQLIVDEGTTSEAGKISLINTHEINKDGEVFRKKNRKRNELSKQMQSIEDYLEDENNISYLDQLDQCPYLDIVKLKQKIINNIESRQGVKLSLRTFNRWYQLHLEDFKKNIYG